MNSDWDSDAAGATHMRDSHDPAPAPRTMGAEILALSLLGWILAEKKRADRLLDLTGLTAERLRAAIDDPSVLGAILEFLINFEPDLIAAAEHLDINPQEIIEAHRKITA